MTLRLREQSDTGTGERFARTFGDRVRYVADLGEWRVYGGWWRRDAVQTVRTMAREIASELVAEALAIPDGDGNRAAAIKFAAECLDNRRQRGMLEAAQSVPPIAPTPGDFDQHPMLFNCPNGTLDLTTGVLRPHDPADLLTMSSPVPYDPAATCPRYLAHLTRTFGDEKIVAFYGRWLGYGLTGDTREQVFLIEQGAPATGKSVNRALVSYLLGDSATSLSVDALMARPHGAGGAARPDLAKLPGKRFASAVETAAGRKFDEVVIKTLTGGDTFAARQVYEREREFKPQFKLSISTNYTPAVSTDPAMWRRVIVLPYANPIPEGERDLTLADRLKAEEGPGILTWAVQGCLEWQRIGLAIPDAVRAATAAQRARLDGVGGFLEEQCITRPGAKCKSAELYEAYLAWCTTNGTDAMTKTAFGRAPSSLPRGAHASQAGPVTGLLMAPLSFGLGVQLGVLFMVWVVARRFGTCVVDGTRVESGSDEGVFDCGGAVRRNRLLGER